MASSLFGTQTDTLQNVIAQKSGVPPAVISKVIAIAVPMVAGYAGKMFIEQKMNPAGLASLLGIQSKMAMQASPEAATLFKILMAIQ